MMRRLLEQADSRDPAVARAARLLASAPADPPGDAMRRRVLASVVRDHPRSLGWAARLRRLSAAPRWATRPAILVAALLATTMAAASFQGGWLPRTYRALQRISGSVWPSEVARHRQPVATEEKQTTSSPAERRDLAGAAPAPQEAPAKLESARQESSAAVAPGRAAAIGTKRRPSRDVKVQGDVAPAPPASESSRGEGAGLVLAAIQTLRRDHDGARAGALLEEYLREHPDGPLREEAMALAVEAASARGDRRETQSLALRYQRAFPDGRFRRLRGVGP